MAVTNLGSVSGQRKWQPMQAIGERRGLGAAPARSEPSLDERTNALEERFRLPKSAQQGGKEVDMIRLILAGAAGWILATRPDLRDRVFGVARDIFQRLTTR